MPVVLMTSGGASEGRGFLRRVAVTVALLMMGAGDGMTGVMRGAMGDGVTARAQAQVQETFRLVSAQVVTAAGDRPPLLRLAANGPIAFQVLTPEESGLPAGSSHLAVRLYGVRPGDLDLATLGGLAPFSLVMTESGTGAVVNIGLAGLATDATLRARAGQRTNELEVVASTTP
jgi:hypothetical protein